MRREQAIITQAIMTDRPTDQPINPAALAAEHTTTET